SERGFGTVEVLVSLLLLMVTAAGGLGLMASSIYATAFSGQVQTATRLAQEVLDRTMVEPYGQIGSFGSACRPTEPPIYAHAQTTQGGAGNTVSYQRTCTVQPLAGPLLSIRTQVSWTERSGRVRTVSLGVLRAQP